MGQNGRKYGQIRRKRTPSLSSHESTIQRSAWSKGGGNLSNHSCADQDTIKTVFRTIISVKQLSLYDTVAEMCEEYESYPDRTGRPVVREQSSPSFVPIVTKTNTHLNDDLAQKNFYCKDIEDELKVITTRQIQKILCWCRIPDYSWIRTVFHDEGYCRILTIHRFSGLLWVHFAKKWRFIWTFWLDQMEH